jgi:hypothetical protein
MKKVALSLIAFGLIGAAAFAQDAPKVTIGEWGRQLFSVIGGKDSLDNAVTQTQLTASWGSTPRIVGLNIQADAGNAGFSITPSADNGTFGLTDQNKAWIKPIDGVTVESGINLQTDTWRGIHDFGNWNWLRMSISHNDSVTFARLGEGGTGFATDINYNKDGIGAWALVQTAAVNTSVPTLPEATTTGPTDLSGIGKHLQIGGAYTIKDIGQLKVQYLGYALKRANIGSQTSGNEYGTYEVAFNLSAVKGLYEEVGLTVPSKGADAGFTFQVSDQVGYAVTDKATVNGQLIYASLTDDNGGKSGAGIAGGLGLDYDLGDSVGFSGDIRYQNSLANYSGASDKDDDAYGVTLGFTKGFANGLIGIAFEYVTGSANAGAAFSGGDALGVDTSAKSQGAWAIPVRLEYWF